CLAASVAAVTRARATTARRKSSAEGPSSLTKAVTSQDDMRMRALPILTVVMERPRLGGAAISCSQICSRQDSKSSTACESVLSPASLAFAAGAVGGALREGGSAAAGARGAQELGMKRSRARG